jgi:hypothetical protein
MSMSPVFVLGTPLRDGGHFDDGSESSPEEGGGEESDITTPLYFDGTSTVLSGGVTAELDYVAADVPIFSMWLKVAPGAFQKASFFCREKRTPNYNGWDLFMYTNGTVGWYAASNYNGSVWVWAAAPVIEQDTWVHVVWQSHRTVAGNKCYYNKVLQTLTANNDTFSSGDMNDPTLEYLMGDANLDSGHNYYKGHMAECVIITGRTLDSTLLDELAPGGVPASRAQIAAIEGAEHHWHFRSDQGDTVTTVYDQIGGVDLTVSGTAVYG